MDSRYRIKSEYKHLVSSKLSVALFDKLEDNIYNAIHYDDTLNYAVRDFSDEMFEKVEEERKPIEIKNIFVDFQTEEMHREGDYNLRINFNSNKLIHCDDIKDTLQSYLNGELVEKPQKLEGNFKITNDTDKTFWINNEGNEVTISDPIRENGTTYYTKRQMDEYCIEKVRFWLTTNQHGHIFDPHDRSFIVKMKLDSFKEHLNSK